MSDYLRRCSRCGLPAYRFDPCPRTYLHPKETDSETHNAA